MSRRSLSTATCAYAPPPQILFAAQADSLAEGVPYGENMQNTLAEHVVANAKIPQWDFHKIPSIRRALLRPPT